MIENQKEIIILTEMERSTVN